MREAAVQLELEPPQLVQPLDHLGAQLGVGLRGEGVEQLAHPVDRVEEREACRAPRRVGQRVEVLQVRLVEEDDRAAQHGVDRVEFFATGDGSLADAEQLESRREGVELVALRGGALGGLQQRQQVDRDGRIGVEPEREVRAEAVHRHAGERELLNVRHVVALEVGGHALCQHVDHLGAHRAHVTCRHHARQLAEQKPAPGEG